MPNTAMVSFKLPPDRYAVLKAMAEAQGKSLSEMSRETVKWALGLESQTRLRREACSVHAAGGNECA